MVLDNRINTGLMKKFRDGVLLNQAAEKPRKNNFISKGKIKSIAVLIVAKVMFSQASKFEKEICEGEHIYDIDIQEESQNEVEESLSGFLEEIDSILMKTELEGLSIARKKAMNVLYQILKHKNLDNPISLHFLGATVLFTYFIEGLGQKASKEFDFFKTISNYDGVMAKYDETDILSFINDQKIALDALLAL